jgi:translation initiation factor IF-1
MPKRQNISKAAAAELQSARAVQKAASGAGGLFMSVQSTKGDGYFRVRMADGIELTATPRGLFTCGSMRISVGQIVVLEGVPEDIKFCRGRERSIPYEIVGVIQERREAEQFVRKGKMPREVLAHALSAGNFEEAIAPELADLFEAPAEADDIFEEGGKKGRRQAEAQAAIRARVELLEAGGAAVVPDVKVDDL